MRLRVFAGEPPHTADGANPRARGGGGGGGGGEGGGGSGGTRHGPHGEGTGEIGEIIEFSSDKMA